MDVVVEDIPPNFGMLLSRYWDSKLKGTLQMDVSYATISLLGEYGKLYRERRLSYVVSSQDKPKNHPIYALYIDLGYSIFYIDFHYEDNLPIEEDLTIVTELKGDKEFVKIQEALEDKHRDEGVWSMYFDG